MNNEPKINETGKPVQGNAGAPGIEPERSRQSVGSPPPHVTEVGAGPADTTGADITAPLANPVPVQPQFFNFDAQGLRVVGEADRPWFIAKDICAALDLERTDSSLRTLDDDEKGTRTVSTLGGPQEMSVINESGLYALIFRSRKPQAKLFRRWVTNEVLPAIRRSGRYDVDGTPKRRRFCEYRSPLTPAVVLEAFAKEPLSRSAGFRTVQAAYGKAAGKGAYYKRINELIDAGLLVRYGQMLTTARRATSLPEVAS